MNDYKILNIKNNPVLIDAAAKWFSSKWKIPEAAYIESMSESLIGLGPVPQWYVVLKDEKIIAGIGVIDNDFHDRKDLTPNVCAVYVEEDYRRLGLGGFMLEHVCNEFSVMGADTLYLLTDHTSYYERYGWKFLYMVQGDGDPELSRMYIHKV